MTPSFKPTLFDLVYQDNHLLVINKKAGALSQGDQTGDLDVLTEAKAYLKAEFDKPGNVFLGLVHRLDRSVSGVMVYARTTKSAQRLSGQFRDKTVEKRYLAIVEGSLEGEGVCQNYLIKENQQVKIVTKDYPKSQYAELHWASLLSNRNLSLLDIRLITGRSHQIRIQLANCGHPVLGDRRYGAVQQFSGRHFALHCYRLTINHPVKKEPITFMVMPPPSWFPFFSELEIANCLERLVNQS